MFRLLLVLCGMMGVSSSLAKSLSLPYWTRSPGFYADNRQVKKSHPGTLTFKKLKTLRFKDPHEEKVFSFKGFDLASALLQADKGSPVDTALLHFKNGMAIPVPLNQMKPLSLVLAVAVKRSSGWQSHFPDVTKNNPLLRDPRPLVFQGHKLLAHEKLASGISDSEFNPFLYADHLIGIEFVHDRAYLAQFPAKGHSEGLFVFANRCRYCHGIRQVGADYGWDVVKPLPIYKKRDAQSLLYHVKYEKNRALEQGLMMPPQANMTMEQAKALWGFFKEAATKKPLPYRP